MYAYFKSYIIPRTSPVICILDYWPFGLNQFVKTTHRATIEFKIYIRAVRVISIVMITLRMLAAKYSILTFCWLF